MEHSNILCLGKPKAVSFINRVLYAQPIANVGKSSIILGRRKTVVYYWADPLSSSLCIFAERTPCWRREIDNITTDESNVSETANQKDRPPILD
jgi:hypothetical protein